MDTPQKARRFYNNSPQYEEFKKSEGWQVPKLLVALTMPYLDGSKRIADIGCGPGLVGKELDRVNWRGALIGVDIAEQRLREAAQKPSYNFCIQADAYRLPFCDQVFDVVLSSAMVGLTNSNSIREMLRILKLGGFFACATGEIKSKDWCRKRFQEAKQYLEKLSGARILCSQDLGSGYTNEYDDEHYVYYLLRKN